MRNQMGIEAGMEALNGHRQLRRKKVLIRAGGLDILAAETTSAV
jgi:hypothetical protein